MKKRENTPVNTKQVFWIKRAVVLRPSNTIFYIHLLMSDSTYQAILHSDLTALHDWHFIPYCPSFSVIDRSHPIA